MKKNGWRLFWVSLLAIAATGCAELGPTEYRPFIIETHVMQPRTGDVYCRATDWDKDLRALDEELGFQTGEPGDLGHTSRYDSFSIADWILKVRLEAKPREGYRFDGWARYVISNGLGTAHYLDLDMAYEREHGNRMRIYALFVPIEDGQSQGETPLDPGPGQLEHDLELVLSPPEGGTVELSGDGGLIEPDSDQEVDEGDPSAWEVKQLYQWTLFGKTAMSSDNKYYEITLKAIPSGGYRFVRWVGEGIEIENPEAISTSLKVPTKELRDATEDAGIPRVYAYFALIPEEPQDEPLPPIQQTLYTSFDGRGQCTVTQSTCSCNLVISVEGKDLTGGSYPVTNVKLTVNGDIWDDSGSISETHYTKTVERIVDCDKTFNIEVIATNSIGQTVSSTGSVTTARS